MHICKGVSCWHLGYLFCLTNCSIIFSLNIHHNFINKFKTTYSLDIFWALFQQNILLWSFFILISTQCPSLLPFKTSLNTLYSSFYDRLWSQVFLLWSTTTINCIGVSLLININHGTENWPHLWRDSSNLWLLYGRQWY